MQDFIYPQYESSVASNPGQANSEVCDFPEGKYLSGVACFMLDHSGAASEETK